MSTDTVYPPFLLESPKPLVTSRKYNGRTLTVWSGRIKIDAIQGWVENPRIELQLEQLKASNGPMEPTQEQVFDIMKTDDEVKLKALRDDIIANGLRDPLTLSFKKKLLDGNRRFFALLWAREILKGQPKRADLDLAEVFVLLETATEEDEYHVLVEENFYPELKVEWPEYVKARKVVQANRDGLSDKEIQKKFRWDSSKVRQTIRTHEIIDDFVAFATEPVNQSDEHGGGLGLSEIDAIVSASKRYQFFNEAQKSFYKAVTTDIDFKIQFFCWVHEGKFNSFQEVRVAYEAWNDPEVKAILSQPNPAAAKRAKNRLAAKKDSEETNLGAAAKIEEFLAFLKKLKVEDLQSLSDKSRGQLKETLEIIVNLPKPNGDV